MTLHVAILTSYIWKICLAHFIPQRKINSIKLFDDQLTADYHGLFNGLKYLLIAIVAIAIGN